LPGAFALFKLTTKLDRHELVINLNSEGSSPYDPTKRTLRVPIKSSNRPPANHDPLSLAHARKSTFCLAPGRCGRDGHTVAHTGPAAGAPLVVWVGFGSLVPNDRPVKEPWDKAFRDLGYVAGQTLRLEYRYVPASPEAARSGWTTCCANC
jgi:hypothetical protein